jgi:hypothetical protein
MEGNIREEMKEMRSVRGNKEMAQTPGVYSMPCECGQVYIGQTGHSIETRIKEQRIHPEQPHRSAMAKHSISLDQHIKLQDTTILSTKPRYMNLFREAIEIQLHPNNVKGEMAFI